MAGRTITVILPEALYERVKETAEASSQSLEAVLAQSIALSLPALEHELSPEVRSELAALPLLSDAELWVIANSTLDKAQQAHLEALANLQKQRSLTTAEQETLAQLMEAAQRIMLRKAETYRLLARRGYTVLASSDPSSG
jgi:hypothetical protein